jgi:DNA-binding transcriptional ArsR family regulator
VLDWEAIARSEVHPTRLAILEQMVSPPPEGDPGWSGSTLAQALELPLATVSHHVRLLRERGLLEVLESRQVRGAMQTFLVLSDAAADG